MYMIVVENFYFHYQNRFQNGIRLKISDLFPNTIYFLFLEHLPKRFCIKKELQFRKKELSFLY